MYSSNIVFLVFGLLIILTLKKFLTKNFKFKIFQNESKFIKGIKFDKFNFFIYFFNKILLKKIVKKRLVFGSSHDVKTRRFKSSWR